MLVNVPGCHDYREWSPDYSMESPDYTAEDSMCSVVRTPCALYALTKHGGSSGVPTTGHKTGLLVLNCCVVKAYRAQGVLTTEHRES